MSLDILNNTGMEMAYITGRIPFPGHSLTLIVKGVFDLTPDGVMQLATEQRYPTGDEFYEDDTNEIGSPRYPSDFGCLKPKSDIMLVGSCHAPEGTTTREQLVSFSVGSFKKTLKILGDTYWDTKILDDGDNVSQPFSRIELRYENSFGGAGYADNPVGKGKQEQESAQGEVRKLFPNILNEYENSQSLFSSFSTAGFGPIAASWPSRKCFLGSYKGDYLKTRWPWYAKDFDFHYFNAAPGDQQIQDYLVGDEALCFENIHPVQRSYKTQLPKLRCRCFIYCPHEDIEDAKFKEVPLNLDTLWVDMDAEQLVLVWRGWTKIQDEDFPEIESIFIISEPLSENAKSHEECQALFTARLEELAADGEVEEEEPEAEDEPVPEPDNLDEEAAQNEQKVKASLLEAGIDIDNLPPRSEEDLAKEKEILKEMGMEDDAPEEEPKPTPDSFMAAFQGGQQFTDIVLENLDLAGQNLSGINFSGSILKNIDFSTADLSKANLTGATLTGVNLTAVNLHQSDLSNADLTNLDLTEANLSETILTGAIFEKTRLHKANFKNAQGVHCYLGEAQLDNAQFQGSDFSFADFNKAQLAGANFSHATLVDATFEEVNAQGIIMDHADLTNLRGSENSDFSAGSFKQTKGAGSMWDGANLSHSDFSYCHLEEADFSNTNLQNANLYAANMRLSRFNKADLSGAKAQFMNLFGGSFKKANLNKTDFSDGNLYGVEFLEADHTTAIFTNTNLKKSKLA